MHGLVHKHKRKIRKDNQPMSLWGKLLDKATLTAGIIGPMMTVPQLYEIYYAHKASGVSALSWLAFGVLDIPFILYGLKHKDRTISITYILWFLANIGVGVGAIIYK